jgi:hypothetical protein
VVTSLTGVPTPAACFLLPVGDNNSCDIDSRN